MPHKPETFQELINHFAAFLTVAVHLILYERDLYPKESFLTARAYNFPVRQSRHPAVCAWVTDAVAAVAGELTKGTVARLVFVIFDAVTSKPLERFVWDVSNWPVVPKTDLLTPMVREGPQETLDSVDLDEQFRAVLSRLSTCSTDLTSLPQGCPFTLAIELKQDADPPVGHPQPWIPSEPESQRLKLHDEQDSSLSGEERIRRGSDLGGSKTIPVRRVDAGEMRFGMWIEEGKAKIDSPDTSVATSFNTVTT